MATSKIIERIRALLALASNNPSEEEAATAAAMAARLMAEHHLAQAEIEAAGGEPEKDEIGIEEPSGRRLGGSGLRAKEIFSKALRFSAAVSML